MCYQRVKTAILWFAPTRKQMVVAGTLLFLAILMGTANERRRVKVAAEVHEHFQEQIDRLAARVRALEEQPH